MKRPSLFVPAVNLFLLVGFSLTLGASCGGPARQLGPALAALSAAEHGLEAWSKATQEGIVDAAPDEETARAEIAAHRAKRDRAVELLTLAEGALAVALAEPSVANIARAVGLVQGSYAALEALRSPPKPAPATGGTP